MYIELDDFTEEDLEQLSEALDQPKEELVVEAIKQYIAQFLEE